MACRPLVINFRCRFQMQMVVRWFQDARSRMENPEIYIGRPVVDVPSPAFLVDKAKVERNCQKMITKCREIGIRLRPQTKTHKTIEAAFLATNGTKRCMVVSTLQEAWFYTENGFEDILYGFPLTPQNIHRCRKIADKLNEFHVMVNNEDGVSAVEDTQPPPGKKWSVFLKIDVGYPRAGIPWSSTTRIIQLAKRLVHSEIAEFRGLYAHCGNSYSTDKSTVAAVRDESVSRLLKVAEALEAEGMPCSDLGIGSTPSCSLNTQPDMTKLTEVHPGNYVFYDSQQESYGSCTRDEIAVRVMTRVVSHHPDRNQLLVDLGFTGLTRQGLDLLSVPGYGRVSDSNLKLVAMTQELGKVETVDGAVVDAKKYPVGTPLYVYPYHACATAGMYPYYYVHDDKEMITEIWRPTRGW